MKTTREKGTLEQIGDAVLLAIPSALPSDLLEELQMEAGAQVHLSVDCGRLFVEPVVEPAARKRYSLQELLTQCDPSAPSSSEDEVWVGAKAASRELV